MQGYRVAHGTTRNRKRKFISSINQKCRRAVLSTKFPPVPALKQMSMNDLVPRSRFGSSRTNKRGRGEGKGEEETRSGKIRIETSADWLFHNARESSTRVLFISLAVPKTDGTICRLQVEQVKSAG